ncbi:hypothetical protein ACJW31_04G046100 [Castanea mollissima]
MKTLRGKTRANIKVTAKDATDPTHSCALDFDNFLMQIRECNLQAQRDGKDWGEIYC